jgi:hypothetical protein
MAIREIGQRKMNERTGGGVCHCTVSWCKETALWFRSTSPFKPKCPVHKIPMAEGRR